MDIIMREKYKQNLELNFFCAGKSIWHKRWNKCGGSTSMAGSRITNNTRILPLRSHNGGLRVSRKCIFWKLPLIRSIYICMYLWDVKTLDLRIQELVLLSHRKKMLHKLSNKNWNILKNLFIVTFLFLTESWLVTRVINFKFWLVLTRTK